MKLFVDDLRDVPRGFDFSAQSYDEAVRLCRMLDFDFISLDYDLGGEKTGLDILVMLKEYGRSPRHINIHSDHITGRAEMAKYAERNFPGAAVTMNLSK